MSFRKITFLLTVLFAVCISCHRLAAQTTAQVSGIVKDPTGAVVPDAQVQMTNTDTGFVRTTTTNEKGEYTLPALAIGPYTLQVKKGGFETYVQTGIVLELNVNPSIIVPLKVGATNIEVQVTSNAAQVETQNPSVNQVIDPAQVVDLPLNGREVTDLIALIGAAVNTGNSGGSAASNTPGTENAGPGGLTNTLDYPGAVTYSVAGSQSNATNYNLDGAQHLDYRTNVGLPLPFPDALSEFSLGVSAMPANLGVHSGGMVNASTKSGSNSFHGNVFYFVRNGFFDATAKTFPSTRLVQGTTGVTSFTQNVGSKDTLQRNQFGGTIGGPIKKDKLFFFGGYQGTMNNSTVGAATTTLPTPLMLAGDFSYLGSTGNANGTVNSFGCTTDLINAPYTGTTTAGNGLYTGAAGNSNVLNPALLSSSGSASEAANQAVIANVVKLYNPNLVDTNGSVGFENQCGLYHYQALPNYSYEGQFVGRVDWQRTKSDTIFGSYFLANTNIPSYYTPGNILSNQGIGQADRFQTAAIGDTLLVGTHGVNTVRLAFNRTATQRTSNSGIPTVCQEGVNVACPNPNNQTLLFGTKPGFEGWDMENSYNGTEGWAWTNGVHQLNVGFTMMHVQMNGDGTYQEDPELTFGTTSSPSTFTDFVIGNLGGGSVLQGGGQISRDGQNQPSAYAQDSWKLLARLQLTGGLRWDPFFAQHNKYGMNSDFNLANYYANTGFSQAFPNMPPGVSFPGDPGFHGTSDTINRLNSFAPRVGFVWDITGQGSMTLRGGYGLFYDESVLWNTMHVVLNPPWGQTVSFTPQQAFTFNGTTPVPSGAGVANPYYGISGLPLPSVYPSRTLAAPTGAAWIFENQNNKAANVQHWDLAIQRQVTRTLLFSATYIGNKTSHTWLGISNNPDLFLNPLDPNPSVTWTGTGSPIIGSGSTMDPTNQTSSPCTIQYNTGTPQAPNIVGLKYNVCNLRSNATATSLTLDTTGYKITNANARKALNLANPMWGSTMQGGVTTAYAWGDGAYNGLLVSIQQRMAHNFSVLGNYTWSRCMDDGEIGQDIGNAALNPLNPKQSSWGPCTSNRKAIGNITVIAQTPRTNSRALNLVEYGWKGSAIFTVTSGSPYNVSAGYDTGLAGYTSYAVQIANPNVAGPVSANTQVPGCGSNSPASTTYPTSGLAAGSSANAPASVHNSNYWINPCAFQLAPLGTYSSQVKNSYVGPANWNGLNVALYRTFALPEHVQLDFRAEAFNAFNHPGYGIPSATLNSNSSTVASETGYGLNSSVGWISSAANTYRIMQFAVKASF